MMQKVDLPESWIWTIVSELGSVASGGTPSTKEPSYWGSDIAWISPSDLTGYSSKFIAKGAKSISLEGLKNSSAVIMPAGSIHFSSRAPIGYVAISANEISTNQGFKSLIPAPGIFSEYIYYYFKSARQLAESLATGTTFKEISGAAFSRMPVPLPPELEQRRIVAKLEALFSELDKGVGNLRTAQQQLKVYRQALLKHAFEGKLTADWRAQNPDKLESAEALLERIHREREVRHQQKLAEWKDAQQAWEAAGKIGRKPAKPREPKALPPMTAEELAALPELPAGWNWVRIGEAFGVYVGSTPNRSTPSYWGGEIPWVSSGEVAFSRIKSTKERITELGYLNASTEIHPSGTVVLAMIGEGKTRGQAAILDVAAAHNQNTAAIRVSESGCLPEFLYFYLCFQYEMTRKLGSGNNQKALNKERVSEMRIPFLSLAEQQALVQLVDEKFSVIDQLELTITNSLQQAESLRQSILKKAFAGQLVAQCPDDEPASVLLERIRSERTAQQPARKRGRKVATSA